MSPLAVHCLLQSSGDLNNEVTDNPHVSLSPSDEHRSLSLGAADRTASYSIFHSEMRLSGTAALRSTLA